MTDQPDNSVTWAEWLIACLIGLGLSLSVWHTLVQGGGLVGGDVYPYFLPQKVVLAESFAQGKYPLWHPLTGLGYPLLAESQAGVFYPPNQILYRLFDVNTAYNISTWMHYWLAFVFTWRFARSQSIRSWPAMLTAVVFVYGWFPARISWEWSIYGGVFFPLTLWLTERLLQRPTRRRFACLSITFGIFLLAGHFTLAFISQLTVIAYAALRTLEFRQSGQHVRRWTATAMTLAAVVMSLLIAAVQTIPTYELKQLSQRTVDSREFDPAFGHMPPVYASQVVASWWYWHTPEVIASQQMRTTAGAIKANTNVVEAHLYWGLLPLTLMLSLVMPSVRRRVHWYECRRWLILLILAMIYATGWLLPMTRHLPGFSFFNGPGRYTIVCAMGGAVIAGLVLDGLLNLVSPRKLLLASVLAAAVTLPDVLASAKYVAHARTVSTSALSLRDESWVRKNLLSHGIMTVRLLAPGPNVGNLFGVSCIPQYLGIGPAIYYDDNLWPATGPDSEDAEFPSAETLLKLESLAVTHILTTEPIPHAADTIELVGAFPDSMLNAIWGRGNQPCYLYRVKSNPQRAVSIPADAMESYEVTEGTANRVTLSVRLSGDAELELRELMYPGWTVSIDDRAATAVDDCMMRTVEVSAGEHQVTWTFEPASVTLSMWISAGCGLVMLCSFLCPTSRHRESIDEPLAAGSQQSEPPSLVR